MSTQRSVESKRHISNNDKTKFEERLDRYARGGWKVVGEVQIQYGCFFATLTKPRGVISPVILKLS